MVPGFRLVEVPAQVGTKAALVLRSALTLGSPPRPDAAVGPPPRPFAGPTKAAFGQRLPRFAELMAIMLFHQSAGC